MFDPLTNTHYNDIYACDHCGRPTFRDAPTFAARNNAVIGELKVLCNICTREGYKLAIIRNSGSEKPYQPPAWAPVDWREPGLPYWSPPPQPTWPPQSVVGDPVPPVGPTC